MTRSLIKTPPDTGCCGGCGKPSSAARPCSCCDAPESACELEPLERPRFTCGMVLSDTDLTALVDWTRSRLALQRLRDGWGVVCGLDVRCLPGKPGWVTVGSGYAIGCCGDDIVVSDPICVDLTGCCTVPNPCGEPVNDDADRNPCGDVVVDIYLSGAETLACVELTEQCGCGGKAHSRQEATRVREGAVVRPRIVLDTRADPADAKAAQFQSEYSALEQLLVQFEAFAKGSPTGDEIIAWLANQAFDPPCDWWDRTCRSLKEADDDAEARAAMALFDLVVDQRNVLLRRACGTCSTDDEVRLARIWLRRADSPKDKSSSCVVTLIDAYKPFRRELSRDTWPRRRGAVNLAHFVWQRWDQVCGEWYALAGDAGTNSVTLPTSATELLSLISHTGLLYWGCEEFPPTPVTIETECLGTRILGFGHVRGEVDQVQTQEQAVEKVRGIGENLSKRLREHKIETVQQLLDAPLDVVQQIIQRPTDLRRVLESARSLVGGGP